MKTYFIVDNATDKIILNGQCTDSEYTEIVYDTLNETKYEGQIPIYKNAFDGTNFYFIYDDVDVNKDWERIRTKRNGLLEETDWTQTLDAPIDGATQTLWASYRQSLRDIPTTYATPSDVVWPTPPV